MQYFKPKISPKANVKEGDLILLSMYICKFLELMSVGLFSSSSAISLFLVFFIIGSSLQVYKSHFLACQSSEQRSPIPQLHRLVSPSKQDRKGEEDWEEVREAEESLDRVSKDFHRCTRLLVGGRTS